MKVKVPTRFAISTEQGEPTHADGTLLPIRVTSASINIDYQRGDVPTVLLTGFLMDADDNYVMDMEAEMQVCSRDGMRYRLVPTENTD